MSRSDSPQAPPGGWPAQRPQADYDLATWTQGLGGAPLPNPKPQPAPAQTYAGAQGYPQPQPTYAAPPAGGYNHQDQGYYWGSDPQAAAAPARQQPAAPQFDPYVPPTTPSRRAAPQPAPVSHLAPAAHAPVGHGYAAAPAPQGYGQPHPGHGLDAGGYPSPQPAAYAPQAPSPQLRGSQYDEWAAAPPPADPRGYDLSSYMPPHPAAPAQPAAPDYGHLTADLGTHGQQGFSDWGHQAGYGQPPAGYGNPQPGYDGQGYEAQQGYADPAQGYADPAQGQAEYDEDQGYEYEEPRRGRKGLMIAAALVGAIVVGGGFTLAYQTLMGPLADGPTPVVKSDEGPAKVKPTDPGGKQFAHSDSKLLGRLGGATPAEGEGGPARKVTTLVVGRDGAIQPPSGPQAAPAPPAVSVPVPGMTLIDVPGADQPPAAASPPPQKAAPIVVQPPADAPPAEVAELPAVTTPVIPTVKNVVPEDPPAPVAQKPKPPVVKTAAIPVPPPAAKPAATPAPNRTNLGYVAVLASVPVSGSSRINALQQFADLQQRYGGILQNKTPDVQEANLGEKGRFHRLVIGPPGSREGANSFCAQLKSAGYTADCWVTGY
jgi:hypothetical protein